jgi:hypothetical protein
VSGTSSGFGITFGWSAERHASPLRPKMSRIFSENGDPS